MALVAVRFGLACDCAERARSRTSLMVRVVPVRGSAFRGEVDREHVGVTFVRELKVSPVAGSRITQSRDCSSLQLK